MRRLPALPPGKTPPTETLSGASGSMIRTSPVSCSTSKRRETRTYAHIFSRGLVGSLRGAAKLNHNPERSAGFVVLKAPEFPSVLVELGYLSNPQDVQSLTSPEWRAKAAGAMVNATDAFFSGSEKPAGAPSGEPGIALSSGQAAPPPGH